MRKKIFAQFRTLQIGTPERKKLVAARYSKDSFADLDGPEMVDLSRWLASASPDDITAALKST
jgi:hypothetical protein